MFTKDGYLYGAFEPNIKEFGIYSDGTHATETTDGLNALLKHCIDNDIDKVKIPTGTYLIDATRKSNDSTWDSPTASGTTKRKDAGLFLRSNLYIDFSDSTIIESPNNAFASQIVAMFGCENTTLSNCTIIGDLYEHKNELHITNFEQGAINSNGTNVNSYNGVTGIRSGKCSAIANGTALTELRNGFALSNYIGVLNNQGVRRKNGKDGTVYHGNKYYIYWYNGDAFVYNEEHSYSDHVHVPTGADSFRLWIPMEDYSDRTIVIALILPDWKDASGNWHITYPTQEFSHGVAIKNSKNCKLRNVEIKQCVSDCICLDDQGYCNNDTIIIENCNLHHARRNGISIVGGHDYYITRTKIHDIQGTLPEAGCDIEYDGQEKIRGGVYFDSCEFYDNNYGHISNANGVKVMCTGCTFRLTKYGVNHVYQGGSGHGLQLHDCRFYGNNAEIYMHKEDNDSYCVRCKFDVYEIPNHVDLGLGFPSNGTLSIANVRHLYSCDGKSKSIELWQAYNESQNKAPFVMKNCRFKAKSWGRKFHYDEVIDSVIDVSESN